MKNAIIAISLIFLSCISTSVLAQGKDPADVVQSLKLQLIELDGQQETLKLQVEQLDESLKPENIEHSLAGIGSTRPEELRAQRRRQLMVERTAAATKLEQLTIKRSQLESQLAAAESKLYEESASGPGSVQNELRAFVITPGWWFSVVSVALFALGVFIAVLIVLRHARGERAQH
jgi:hypothetical protein